MKVLGPVMVSREEQRALAPGASLDLPRGRLTEKMLLLARIGDLMWVQEPWALVQSRQFGPQHISEAMVGPVGGDGSKTLSDRARVNLHQLSVRQMSALSLVKADSRRTFEIMGINEHSIRVLIHDQQIDAFCKARAA